MAVKKYDLKLVWGCVHKLQLAGQVMINTALAEQSVDWKVKLKIWATCTELQAATATTSVIGFIFLSSHNEQKNSDKILF